MATERFLPNGVPIYKGKKVIISGDINKMIQAWDDNQKRMMEIDAIAKNKGELLGRFIMEPVADGKACYQIVKVNKRTVRIKRVTGIGDDYTVPYWGDEASVDLEYATNSVIYRDNLDALFCS